MAQVREYPGAKLLAVTDGDTITVSLDLGFNLTLAPVHIRLHGLDAPEKSAPEGQLVCDWLTERLKDGRPLLVRTFSSADKYGRCLAIVFVGDSNINEEMIQLGLARPYSGQGLKPWPKQGG